VTSERTLARHPSTVQYIVLLAAIRNTLKNSIYGGHKRDLYLAMLRAGVAAGKIPRLRQIAFESIATGPLHANENDGVGSLPRQNHRLKKRRRRCLTHSSTRSLRRIDFPSRSESRLRNTDSNYQKIAGDGVVSRLCCQGIATWRFCAERQDECRALHFSQPFEVPLRHGILFCSVLYI
jgi:hypothetical protein